jgi:hypothetical protein
MPAAPPFMLRGTCDLIALFRYSVLAQQANGLAFDADAEGLEEGALTFGACVQLLAHVRADPGVGGAANREEERGEECLCRRIHVLVVILDCRLHQLPEHPIVDEVPHELELLVLFCLSLSSKQEVGSGSGRRQALVYLKKQLPQAQLKAVDAHAIPFQLPAGAAVSTPLNAEHVCSSAPYSLHLPPYPLTRRPHESTRTKTS